jgi:hypothetical protein
MIPPMIPLMIPLMIPPMIYSEEEAKPWAR